MGVGLHEKAGIDREASKNQKPSEDRKAGGEWKTCAQTIGYAFCI